MAEVVIKQIEEGMTGRQVADLLYSNFLALVGAIGSGGGGDIPTADIEKGVTAYGWGDHRQAGYLKGITGGMVTGALGYTPMDEAALTKANIKATLGIADWALAASKPAYTTKEVAEDGNLYFTDARAVAALAGVTNALAGDIGANATAIGVLQGYFTNGVAKSAAKLATSRKLWGQSFDGTADVTGALTGVTDITASGTLTIGKIKIGDGVIEWDAANGGFKVTGGLWATDYLSSKGVNTGASGGGGGSSYQRLDTWDGYTSAKDGWVLSAKLGYGLKTTQDDILRQLANITGQGTNVTFTPALTSGTQIGTLTIDGEPVKMYAPSIPTDDINKGVTAYGWGNHASVGYAMASALGGYLPLKGGTLTDTITFNVTSSYLYPIIKTAYNEFIDYRMNIHLGATSGYFNIFDERENVLLRIDKSSGNVGIGITSPQYKLDVNGTINGTTLYQGGKTLDNYYLPLSGGTLTGAIQVGAFTSFGVSGDNFYLGSPSYPLHIRSNGDAKLNNNTLIHSGNIGSQSVSYATSSGGADVIASTYANQSINMGAESRVRLISITSDNAIDLGAPKRYVSGLSVMSNYVGWQLVSGASQWNNEDFYIRKIADNGVYLDWRQIAFTDSNVASATKLNDNSAYTIWGQTFFENGKPKSVSGCLTLGGVQDLNIPQIQFSQGEYFDFRSNLVLHSSSGNWNIFSETASTVLFRVNKNGSVLLGGRTTDDNIGVLQINTASTKNAIALYDTARPETSIMYTGNDGYTWIVGKGVASTGDAFGVYRSGLKFLITSSGYVGVNTSNPICHLDVKGAIHSTTGIWSDGYVSAKGQNTSSDMRLKRVLEEVTLSVDEIAEAPAFRFEWKGGAGVDVGTSAQYWEKVLPDVVKRDDAGWLTMQYGNAAMVAVISLARKVKELEEKLGIKN